MINSTKEFIKKVKILSKLCARNRTFFEMHTEDDQMRFSIQRTNLRFLDEDALFTYMYFDSLVSIPFPTFFERPMVWRKKKEWWYVHVTSEGTFGTYDYITGLQYDILCNTFTPTIYFNHETTDVDRYYRITVTSELATFNDLPEEILAEIYFSSCLRFFPNWENDMDKAILRLV